MAVWPYGGTPDSYVRDDDTLQLLPGARIVPLVAVLRVVKVLPQVHVTCVST